MIYLCAGVYAEGPTDYRFLLPLTTRLITEIAASLFPAECEVADSVGIDAPSRVRSRRRLIPAAIDDYWTSCTIFVVHSDGAGDPQAAHMNSISPGVEAARLDHPGLVAVACIPVREIEAWLLADEAVFQQLFGRAPELPMNPEADTDPKATFRRVISELGGRSPGDFYAVFGERVDLRRLRSLSAFARFEADLSAAIRGFGTAISG